MRVWTTELVRVAIGAVALCCFQGGTLPAAAQQEAAPPIVEADKDKQAPPETSPSQQPPTSGTPQNAGQLPPEAPASQVSSPESLPQAPEPQVSPSPQKPVGTATAETTNASGVAASQPAGVAIAPAKQRRVRTIVLRVGALVGAGVAVGTVIGLTRATPSKPPGAH